MDVIQKTQFDRSTMPNLSLVSARMEDLEDLELARMEDFNALNASDFDALNSETSTNPECNESFFRIAEEFRRPKFQ